MFSSRTVTFRQAIGSLIFVGALGACFGHQKEELGDATFRYNDCVRWGQNGALKYLPAEQQAQMMTQLSANRHLRVTDAQVEGVQQQAEDKALVMVRFDWYTIDRGTVNSSMVAQKWERNDYDQWMVTDQQQTAGAPFPLIPTSVPEKPATPPAQ